MKSKDLIRESMIHDTSMIYDISTEDMPNEGSLRTAKMTSAMMLSPQPEAKQHPATKRHRWSAQCLSRYSKNASLGEFALLLWSSPLQVIGVDLLTPRCGHSSLYRAWSTVALEAENGFSQTSSFPKV